MSRSRTIINLFTYWQWEIYFITRCIYIVPRVSILYRHYRWEHQSLTQQSIIISCVKILVSRKQTGSRQKKRFDVSDHQWLAIFVISRRETILIGESGEKKKIRRPLELRRQEQASEGNARLAPCNLMQQHRGRPWSRVSIGWSEILPSNIANSFSFLSQLISSENIETSMAF